MTPATLHDLAPEQKEKLSAAIYDFLAWLRTKVPITARAKNFVIEYPRATPADWLMWVGRPTKETVQFNTHIVNRCSFAYFEMVVLHECFHLFVQDLPNKEDAKRLKDDFGDHVMKLLDIEADFYTALYLKERRRMKLTSIFALFYEGSRVFGDPKIRVVKLERFIGSVLSIANLYLSYPLGRRITDSDIFLPNISNIPTEDSLHILIARKSHFVLSNIQADIQDFYEMKRCYTNIGSYTLKGYVERLLSFATKALKRELPDGIRRELLKLERIEQQTIAARAPISGTSARKPASRRRLTIAGR